MEEILHEHKSLRKKVLESAVIAKRWKDVEVISRYIFNIEYIFFDDNISYPDSSRSTVIVISYSI